MALVLAVAANRVHAHRHAYRTFLIWPYAVAPALAGVLWFFMMNPSLGIIAYWLEAFWGVDWNHYVNGNQALIMVIIAAAWKQISYNFLFFLAGFSRSRNP
jgi:sn-glycerol 3-phosphate transport system permease protein